METTLTVGTKIYYTGDMANSDGTGVIVAVVDDPKWGTHLDIAMDDGRQIRGLMPVQFQSSPGRRFWRLDEWRAVRERRLEESKREMLAILAKQGL